MPRQKSRAFFDSIGPLRPVALRSLNVAFGGTADIDRFWHALHMLRLDPQRPIAVRWPAPANHWRGQFVTDAANQMSELKRPPIDGSH